MVNIVLILYLPYAVHKVGERMSIGLGLSHDGVGGIVRYIRAFAAGGFWNVLLSYGPVNQQLTKD